MVKSGSLLSAAVMVLAIAGAACADLMPIPHLEVGSEVVASVVSPAEEATRPRLPLVPPRTAELASKVVGLMTEPDAGSAADEPDLEILADASNSLDLCLYALIGLGLVRSGHWVRRPALGFIPEWYHNGGPHQVGHSHAVGPDAFCLATICFIQTDCVTDNLIPRYGSGTHISLRGESQFTARARASRGPPWIS